MEGFGGVANYWPRVSSCSVQSGVVGRTNNPRQPTTPATLTSEGEMTLKRKKKMPKRDLEEEPIWLRLLAFPWFILVTPPKEIPRTGVASEHCSYIKVK